jgi:uncharacterized delta-60 repeat protein
MLLTHRLRNRGRAPVDTNRSLIPASFRPKFDVLEDRSVPAGGVLDPTFGAGGIDAPITALGGSPAAVTTYPQIGSANDGKIVAAGFTDVVTGHHGYVHVVSEESVVARYNLDGTLDASFGTGGQVINTMSVARAVAVQKDGKVLVAGGVIAGGVIAQGANSLALARYNPDGSPDASFGTGGMVTVAFAAGSDTFGEGIALQPDGKIVVAGGNTTYSGKNKTLTATGAIVLVRFNVDGTLDTSFNKTGKVLSTVPTNAGGGGEGGFAMGLALDPATGRITVEAPDSKGKEMVVCFTTGGLLDTKFGGTGFLSMPDLYSRQGVAIQPKDHKIVLAGETIGGTETLVQLNYDGTPDVTFGVGGTIATKLVTYGVAQTLILQPDGHILLGTSGDGGENLSQVMEVARFDPAGKLDTFFGHGGVAHTAPRPDGVGNDFAAMTVEPDGRIVLLGADVVLEPYLNFNLARFLATGPQIGSLISTPGVGSVTLTASAITDGNPGATVTQVTFFYYDVGGNKVTLNGTPDGSGGWSIPVNLPSGTTVYAQALDSLGALGDPVFITI